MTTSNTVKTAALLAALTALFLMLGTLLGGFAGAIIALVFAGALNLGTYWFSDRLALRMAGAKEVTEADEPQLYAQVAQLATLARLPMPKVCVIETDTPNAFATGRDPQHAAVAVTTGIRHLLTTDELSGVIAHELAHIRNRDTLIASVVGAVAGAITWIANMIQFSALFGGLGGDRDDDNPGGFVGALVVATIASLAAGMIQLAISRSREFQADAVGAKILGDPIPLARALEKLHAGVARRPLTAGNPATAHLYIVNPFAGANVSRFFSTHPPVEERVKRLCAMALEPA